MNEKSRKGTYTREEVEDEVLQKRRMELDEWEIKMGGRVEGHGDVDEGDVSLQVIPPAGDAWAKLVDDAVGVWEGKRRRCVEELGWEVCSDVGTRERVCSPCGWEEMGVEVGGENEDEGWDKVSVCTV